MRDSDQAIEKVLAGLRDAEAPAGMERRILETVQNHASTHSRWGWLTAFSPLISARPMAYASALACVVALVLGVHAIHYRQIGPTPSTKTPASTLLTLAPLTSVAASVELQKPTTITRSPRRMKPRKPEVIDPEESLAMREVNAPSRPAPPLPLTEQEKLLVRFVRTHTSEELAAIDPAKWASQDDQQRIEFDRFFRLLTKEQADKKKLVQEAMNKS